MKNPVFQLPKSCGTSNIVKYLKVQFDKHLNLIIEISEPHIESEISQQIIGIENSLINFYKQTKKAVFYIS